MKIILSNDVRIIELLEKICDRLSNIEHQLEDLKSFSSDTAANTSYCDSNTTDLGSKLDAIITLLAELKDLKE